MKYAPTRPIIVSDQKENARDFSRWMLAVTKRLSEIWHRFGGGDITRYELIGLSVHMRSKIVRCLKKYSSSETSQVRKLATRHLACQDGLFTFLYHDVVEPTSNSVERGVRPAVM